MKKMHLAHSDMVLKKLSIPDIKVTDVSSSAKNDRNPDPKVVENGEKVASTNLIALPTSHHHPLKAAQSHLVPHHAPTIAEQGKHVYHSEPANLNGFVRTSPELFISVGDIEAERLLFSFQVR